MTNTIMNAEMTKLVVLLAKAHIPFSIIGTDRINYYTDEEYITFNICVPGASKENDYSGSIDAASADSTYGGREGLIEIMGFRACKEVTDYDAVGWLTAEKAFDLIKKAWEIINK